MMRSSSLVISRCISASSEYAVPRSSSPLTWTRQTSSPGMMLTVSSPFSICRCSGRGSVGRCSWIAKFSLFHPRGRPTPPLTRTPSGRLGSAALRASPIITVLNGLATALVLDCPEPADDAPPDQPRRTARPGVLHARRRRGGQPLVFVSGQVSEDADDNLVGEGDFAAQALQAFANLGRCLAAAGAAPEQVARITIYVVGHRPAYLPLISAARVALFGEHKPAEGSSACRPSPSAAG